MLKDYFVSKCERNYKELAASWNRKRKAGTAIACFNDDVDGLKQWVEDNCTNNVYTWGGFIYVFDNKQEAMRFKMTWC